MKFMLLTATLFVLALSFGSTNAIKCWECDNAVDDEDCKSRGRLRTCQANQDSCFTETRSIQDGRKLITRRCKQTLACQNNKRQNLQPAWDPTQCNKNGGSVCRCCCTYNGCNGNENTQCLKEKPQNDPEKIDCKLLPQVLENGEVNCVKAINKLTCNYKCNEGYEIVGKDRLVCDKTNYEKQQKAPVCREIPKPKYCDFPKMPTNGGVRCNFDGNENLPLGHTCEYKCKPGYELVGSEITTCRNTLDGIMFDIPPPFCRPIQCPDQTNLRRVVKKCSQGNLYKSECSFECEGEFNTPNPGDVMQNTCLRNGMWSHPAPCCRLPCPPHTVMDLFVVLDSSSSVGVENFEKMRSFIAEVLGDLTLDVNHTQAFVMTYSWKPDPVNQVLINKNENQEQILEALRTIPGDGKGTKTGKALKYVRNKMLKKPENRPEITDVVLLVTDGHSQDDVDVISTMLRRQGVELFVVGVTNDVNDSQLMDITGNRDKILSDIDDFDELAKVASTIGNTICNNSCK